MRKAWGTSVSVKVSQCLVLDTALTDMTIGRSVEAVSIATGGCMSAQSRKATKVDTRLATTSNDAACKEPGYSSATAWGPSSFSPCRPAQRLAQSTPVIPTGVAVHDCLVVPGVPHFDKAQLASPQDEQGPFPPCECSRQRLEILPIGKHDHQGTPHRDCGLQGILKTGKSRPRQGCSCLALCQLDGP
jgi:hypothetical protein